MWTDHLTTAPLDFLLDSDNHALLYMVKRDLLDDPGDSVHTLWNLPEPTRLIRKQREDGAWKYRGNRPGDELGENYELLETWRNLRNLVEMYGFDRSHSVVEKSAEYIFSCQTGEGDIRGILSNQYTPYYMGAFMEALIKAGYGEDERIYRGFHWLEHMQQDEGGWIIPMTMFKMKEYYGLCQKPPIPPDKGRPFSHMATGMVIRAYAAHSVYRKNPVAIKAGELLKSRFFIKDAYTSRQAVDYWFKLQFPFWWTSVLTVMDSLMRMEFDRSDTDIQKALDWFIKHQEEDGGWKTSYLKSSETMADLWVTFAVCRMLKYFLG